MSSCTATASAGAPGPWSGLGVPVNSPASWTNAMTDTTYPVTFPANTTSATEYYTYTLGCAPTSGTAALSSTINISVPPNYVPSVDLKFNGADCNPAACTAPGGPATLTWTSSTLIHRTATAIPSESGLDRKRADFQHRNAH